MMKDTEPSPAARNNGNWWKDRDHPQGARNNGPGWQDREPEEARNNGQSWQDHHQEVRNDRNGWRQQEGRNDWKWSQQEGSNGWRWSSTHGWQWDTWGEPEPESISWDTATAADGRRFGYNQLEMLEELVRICAAIPAAAAAVGARLDDATALETTHAATAHYAGTDTPSAITGADSPPISVRNYCPLTTQTLRAEKDAESSSSNSTYSSTGFLCGSSLPGGGAENAAAPPPLTPSTPPPQGRFTPAMTGLPNARMGAWVPENLMSPEPDIEAMVRWVNYIRSFGVNVPALANFISGAVTEHIDEF